MKVLKFEASWCGPCKMLSKLLENVEGKYTTAIEVVDIDENPDLAKKFHVRGVPTMVKLEDDGETEIERKVGMMNETDLLKFLG